jgi:hypothetical protein
MRLDKLSRATVAALEDIKGRDIVVLDVTVSKARRRPNGYWSISVR